MSRLTCFLGISLLTALIIIHSTWAVPEDDDPDSEWLEDEYLPPTMKEEEMVSSQQRLTNLSVRFDKLSWKILCDEQDWRNEFEIIRKNLTRCLELSRILYPEEEEEQDEGENDTDKMTNKLSFMFSDGMSNPYCRLSKNWISCHVLLRDNIRCLDPDPKPLLERMSGYTFGDKIRRYLPSYPDPNEWIYMHRPYKMLCLMSKMATKYNPLNLMGSGGFF